jgi:hypothetical protein
LIFEMTNGSEFSDKWFRWLWYAAIMIKHLKLKEEEKITVDTLANILY